MERPSDVMTGVFPCAPLIREPLKRGHTEDATRVSTEAPAIVQCWGAHKDYSRFDVCRTFALQPRRFRMAPGADGCRRLIDSLSEC